jgi:ketosteroid isomerase-like protein
MTKAAYFGYRNFGNRRIRKRLMSNIEIIQQVYDAFAAEDPARVLELCDAQCVITQDSALPWGGRHQGFDGLATFAAALGGTIHSVVTTDELFVAGDRVIQYGRSRGTVLGNGATFDVPEVHVWTVRDGKVVAAEFYIDSVAMLHALGRVS